MKRVVLYAVALCLVISVAAGCTGISGLENETEAVTEAYEDVTDTEIVKRFYEAYDFWVSWIYGQDKDYDFMPEYAGFDFGPYLCAIKEDAPIQSVAELEAEMKKYFTKELCERFMAATRPVEIDGRLCMYGGDVGGPYSEAKNIAVEKIDDERYRLKLDIWSCMDEEQPDLPDQIVYYVFEDGAWVFENDDEDEFFYCEELPEYLNEEYAPYNEILRTYYAALWQKWDEEKRAKHNLTDVIRYYDDENRMKNVGYCMLDLDADGQKELLIGTMEYEVNDIYDLYTVKDGRAVQVALGWERCRFYIYEEDGKYKIIKHGSGGASLISDDHYVLEKGSLKHEWSVVMDGFADPKNPWFLADDDEFDVTDDTPISQEKYLELTEGYHGKSLKPEYIPFETLGQK